jgi:membrane associated rhomboid family serine protease/TPR repeat protein
MRWLYCVRMRLAPKISEAPKYPVIAGTALLAIGVTVAWWLNADISPLFENAMIRRGQLWRLLTSILPHDGVIHLAFNIYWLWAFGTILEHIYGHFKTATLILLFAVGPSAMEFAFASGGIGLSGVGYGLFGLLWVLSENDVRFHDAMDRRTVELFVAWFFLCIIATLTNIMRIANIAHGVGAILGILTGFAISRPNRRIAAVAGICAILVFAYWGATLGRPHINLSRSAGYDEARWGYEALVANRNQEAVKWFHDAVLYQPDEQMHWHNLGVAYYQLGNKSAAVSAFRTAAEHGAASDALYLGTLYTGGVDGVVKDAKQAAYWYRKASASNDADILNDVAWQYATSLDPEIHNPSAALECARKAVDLDHSKTDAYHLDTLAEAYYANGEFGEAVRVELQALPIADLTVKETFREHLEKYQHALRKSPRDKRA